MTDESPFIEKTVTYYRWALGWEGDPSKEEIRLREYIDEYLELGPRNTLIRNLAILGISPYDFEYLLNSGVTP